MKWLLVPMVAVGKTSNNGYFLVLVFVYCVCFVFWFSLRVPVMED